MVDCTKREAQKLSGLEFGGHALNAYWALRAAACIKWQLTIQVQLGAVGLEELDVGTLAVTHIGSGPAAQVRTNGIHVQKHIVSAFRALQAAKRGIGGLGLPLGRQLPALHP